MAPASSNSAMVVVHAPASWAASPIVRRRPPHCSTTSRRPHRCGRRRRPVARCCPCSARRAAHRRAARRLEIRPRAKGCPGLRPRGWHPPGWQRPRPNRAPPGPRHPAPRRAATRPTWCCPAGEPGRRSNRRRHRSCHPRYSRSPRRRRAPYRRSHRPKRRAFSFGRQAFGSDPSCGDRARAYAVFWRRYKAPSRAFVLRVIPPRASRIFRPCPLCPRESPEASPRFRLRPRPRISVCLERGLSEERRSRLCANTTTRGCSSQSARNGHRGGRRRGILL